MEMFLKKLALAGIVILACVISLEVAGIYYLTHTVSRNVFYVQAPPNTQTLVIRVEPIPCPCKGKKP